MRAFLTPLALLLTFSACAALPAPPRQASPMAPLRAWISPPGSFGTLGFYINRPAHVAVFEIVPGQGIGMVYPSYGYGHGARETHLAAGMHTVFTGGSSFRWAYQSALGGYGYRSAQPRFYYLVASEAPLRISSFVASPMALRSTIGWQNFTAWNPYSAMEELTRLILPMQGYGEWTTDLYVDWPEPQMRQMPQYVVVTCRDGRQLMVPVGYGFTSCPGDRVAALPPTETGEPEGEVQTPTRRRPEPTAGDRRAGDSPRWRPDPADAQSADPAPRRREPTEARREREEVRERPARTREAEERRAEPRGREARESEPRSETRPAPPPRSQEPRAEPRSAPPPRSEPRSEPSPRSEPRSEPRPARERAAEPPPVLL
ncbi:MAG TPA: hypothetical protein VGR27_08835 [Longimicrobiaceae bacterium]|nr:hypothetical protein [Longimicrobiaceae bacterium]